jgi:hypothetical protein
MQIRTSTPELTAGNASGGGIRMFALGGGGLAFLLLALFVLNVLLHFPGTMQNDSIQQYRQALSGQYQDWHPPAMAWLWGHVDRFGPGPAPMLLLHLGAYWLGFALLADGLRRVGHPRLALLMACAGAFPPFLALNASVIKDVGLVASWIAAVGAVFWFRVQARRIPLGVWLVVAALVGYGALVRSNAIFGLGPLLLLLAWRSPAKLQWPALAAAAVVAAVLALPASQWVNRHVFNAQPAHGEFSLYLFDLLGIAAHTRQPALLEPRATLTQQDLDACYTPYWWDTLSPWGRCASKVHRQPGDPELVTLPEGIAQQWVSAITQHPVAYALHRLKHFNSAVLFAVPLKHVRLVPEYQADEPSFKSFGVVTQSDIRLDLLRKNFMIWPVTWLAWGIVLLVFLHRQPASDASEQAMALARVLTVSALGYSGAYLLIGVATDMRYHYWSMLAIMVATILVLPMLALRWRQRDRRLTVGLGVVCAVVLVGLATRLLDVRVLL